DRGSLVKSFRALVQSVTVHPNGPREGFQIEVKGNLGALIGGDAFPQAVYSGGRVVAEVRYSLSALLKTLCVFGSSPELGSVQSTNLSTAKCCPRSILPLVAERTRPTGPEHRSQ